MTQEHSHMGSRSVPAGILADVRKSMGRYRVRLYALFLALLTTVAVVTFLVASAQRNQETQVARLDAAYHQVLLLDALLLALVDAETGERGFVITGDETFLQPYHDTVARFEERLAELRATLAENSPHGARMAAVEDSARAILRQLQRVIAVYRDNGYEAARELILSQTVKLEMDRLRTLMREWIVIETRELAEISQAVHRAARLTEMAILVGFGLSALLLVVTFALTGRETVRRERTEMALIGSRDELAEALAAQKALLVGRERLRRFMEGLQTCESIAEAQQVLASSLPDLVAMPAGALALQNPSRTYLEVVHSWGAAENLRGQKVFEPTDCLSLRRGRPLWCEEPARDPCCRHLQDEDTGAVVCYPLTAHNQLLGCLMLWGSSLPPAGGEVRELVDFAAETLSVVLANLKLDETLRYQAVVDPLTGLFNRRHMEATLERELARAARNGEPLAVVLADIDHFKQYNDQQGHDAADAVLAAFAQTLLDGVRTEDVACRYGGEEFLLVLPGASAGEARDRMEQLRAAVAAMRPRFHRDSLPGVTASFGIAVYPAQGNTTGDLIRAADQALYAAKRGGRNQVVVADGT